MASHKLDRTAQDIKRCLSEIIRELKDPRISEFVSIVRVEVSGDLSYAKIYVSALEGPTQTADTVKGLNSAKGYIKRALSKAVSLRKMPELRFIPDSSIAHGAQIAQIISDFNSKERTDDED